MLDGSQSIDTDDGIASYFWTQVDGCPVNLSDPDSSKTTFTTPPSEQNCTNLTFKLTVTDFGGLKSSADCMVYVTGDTEPSTIIILEAEDMPIKTTGGPTSGGWNIWSNGYITDQASFPTEGTYTFEISAKGSFAGGAWPEMELRIDNLVVGTVTVNSSSWAEYTIEADVSYGIHEVALAFTNDYYNSSEDRNLYVDKITLTPSRNILSWLVR